MATWPRRGPVVPPILSPWFAPPLTWFQGNTSANGSMAWGITNLAMFFPFILPEPCMITKLFWQNGTTVAGTVDIGWYTAEGGRIISTGPQTQTGVSTTQLIDIADTPLPPGPSYLGLLLSSPTATLWAVGGAAVFNAMPLGVYQQAVGSGTLPNPATFASVGTAGFPLPKAGALVAPRTVL
jgi:hypothetical protein